MEKAEKFSDLKREQKEAIGLVSIGTFLEYFDLMLYVHMAVLLNSLFFPPTDPHTTALLSAAAFCSTYVLRPFAALLFGWIGDNMGRKTTVILTTVLMSISCIVMATLQTYDDIGIAAAWIMTICRIVQGMSSMGEVIGAELYVSEITKPPIQYPAVSVVNIFASLGSSCALIIANFSIVYGFNWRIAFCIGALIAIVGAVARTRLRETPEFVDAKLRLQLNLEKFNRNIQDNRGYALVSTEKVNQITTIALFLMQSAWPVCFYLVYFHAGTILKNSFGYSPEQIIQHNLIVSIFQIFGLGIMAFLSRYIYPITLLKFKLVIFTFVSLAFIYSLNNIKSPSGLLYMQILTIMCSLSHAPAVSIFFRYFPVFKRFTYVSFSYALSRAISYVITSFGIVYLTSFFGNVGVLLIIWPIILGFAFGIYHFEKLEISHGNIIKKKKTPIHARLMDSAPKI